PHVVGVFSKLYFRRRCEILTTEQPHRTVTTTRNNERIKRGHVSNTLRLLKAGNPMQETAVVQIDDPNAIVFQFRDEQALAPKIDGQMVDAAFYGPERDLSLQFQWALLRLSCAPYRSERQDKQYKRVNRTRCAPGSGTRLVYYGSHDAEFLSLHSVSPSLDFTPSAWKRPSDRSL